MIETWMVSLATALVTALVVASGQWFVLKSKVAHNLAENKAVKRNQDTIFKRMDSHGDEIIALKTKAELAMTAKDVDAKYVSRDVFSQFEKHVDKRFDTLEKNLAEILVYVRATKQ